ncbi:MAG: alanine dehydrogenase [Balneolales bacterium]
MEIIDPAAYGHQFGVKTLEKRSEKSSSESSLKIGLPRERSNDENRISLTPGGVSVLTENGHEVCIEKDAGKSANHTDHDYTEAGATIAYSSDELYKKSELIVKVSPPNRVECDLLQENQILFSALHLGNTAEEYLKILIKKNITGIGYEFIQGADRGFPIVRMMHEITGSMSVQIAAHYLESNQNGQGIMLGGISGVPPAIVVILGNGIIAEYAARTALGYGAQVFIMDNDLAQLRHLENALDRRVITAMANPQYLASALKVADVVIGAAMDEGNRAPCWITENMVRTMKSGSVIVDTVIDQGGCVDTSRPTKHTDPVFTKHDVIHYCVPNIPSAVARTATGALNNVIVPFLINIGDSGGINEALWSNIGLRNGTYVYKRHLTKKTLSNQYDLSYRDIDMLIASSV